MPTAKPRPTRPIPEPVAAPPAKATQTVEQGLVQTVEQGLTQTVEQGLTQTVEQGLTQTVEQGLTQTVEQGLTQTVEQGLVQTRHGFPVYVPTQMKTLAPRTPTPLVLDAWVRNQIESGGLMLVDPADG